RRAAARGAICWVGLDSPQEVATVVAAAAAPAAAVAFGSPRCARELLFDASATVAGAVLRADLPRDRELAVLAFGELRARGRRVRIERRAVGPLAARRALAGVEPGGTSAKRASRLAAAFLGARHSGSGGDPP